MKAYEAWRSQPYSNRGDIRGRRSVNSRQLTDKELFSNLPVGDVWVDSGIHMVFMYLYGCKHLQLPSWSGAFS